MHLLHQNYSQLLNFGELKEAVVCPMGCISVHKGLIFQTPPLGVVSNVKRKKDQACVLVLRRRNCIRNAVPITQTESNMVSKEDTEFKSSFDEYLKAMESIRVEREKKQVQRESNHGKKSSNVISSNNVSRPEKRNETSRFSTRNLGEKKQVHRGTVRSKKLNNVNGVVDKKEVRDGLEARTKLNSEKELNYVRLKNGSSEKRDVDSTSSRSTDLVKKLNEIDGVFDKKELNYGSSKKNDVYASASRRNELSKKKSLTKQKISVDDDLEMERFIFQSSESINDGLNGPRVSQMEMEERIQALAKRLNEAGMDMPEWMFAKTMRSARIRFSDSSIMRVIKILGKFGNWRRVLQVIEWLQMHERFKSHKIRYVYTAALDVLGKARRPVEALNLFYAMLRHRSTYPDIVTYHSIAVTLGQAGHMRELFDVIDTMRSIPKNFKIDDLDDWDPRLEPDIVIYNAVLNGCAKRKEWEGAIWVLQKLDEIGEQLSSATYGLAMEVMLACGKYDLVHEYFKQVQGITVPNALSYRVLVNTLWRENRPDEAIEAVQDMESQGLVGPASLYYDLARCLCSVGRCEEGLMQVDKICKVASKPLVVTYTGLVQACLTNKNMQDAISIFNRMQEYCSPNTVTCNIMLKAYIEYGMLDDAKDLFQKMTQNRQKGRKIKSSIIPDYSTFKMMLETFIKEQRWDDFEYAYEQMLKHGHPFDTKRHLWMVLQASSAGKVEVVETTWKHLLRTNRIPPPALVKERFRQKMETNNLIEAISSVDCHPSSHQLSFSKQAWLNLFKNNPYCFNKEALSRLICEINNTLTKSELPNLIYQNLLESCIEYVSVDTVCDRTYN